MLFLVFRLGSVLVLSLLPYGILSQPSISGRLRSVWLSADSRRSFLPDQVVGVLGIGVPVACFKT